MTHDYVVGPFALVDGKLVFVPGKPGPTINPDLARDREVVLAEVVASLTDDNLHDVCRTRQISLVDDGIGFGVDHLDCRPRLFTRLRLGLAGPSFGCLALTRPSIPRVFDAAALSEKNGEHVNRP